MQRHFLHQVEPDEPKRGLRKEEGDQQEEGGGKQGHLHQDIGCEYLSILGLEDIDIDPDIEKISQLKITKGK